MTTLATRLPLLPQDCRRLLQRMLAWSVLAAIMDGLCGLLLLPLIQAWMAQDGSAMLNATLALLAATAIQIAWQYWALLQGFRCGGGLAGGLTRQLIQKLPQLAPSQLGHIVRPENLLRHQVMQAMGVPAHILGPLISAVVTPLTVIIGLIWLAPRLAALLCLTAIGLAALLRLINRRSNHLEQARQQAEQAMATHIGHFAAQQALLRASGRNNQALQQLDGALASLHQRTRQLLAQGLPHALSVGLAVQGMFVVLLFAGVWASQQQALDVGLLVAVLILLVRFIEPLSQLSHLDQALRQSEQAMAVLTTVLQLPTLSSPAHSPLPQNASLSTHGLGLNAEDGRPLLQNVNLNIAAGQLVAIVGPSGAGKSTLLTLLARLLDPSLGQVRYADLDARHLSATALSASRNLVFQHNGLFQGSLEWNVRMASPQASRQALCQALNQAAWPIDEANAEALLATDVGAAGCALSGGERQRLCLARAFLSPAPILLLDEPTASLDALSSAQVRSSLAQMRAHRTVVAVTHDLALAKLADWVVVIDDRTVLAQGPYHEVAPW